MLGLICMSTSPDSNVGVVRELTLEPNIKSARGYIEIKNDKLSELKDVNLFSGAELLTPGGAVSDDAIRTAMAVLLSLAAYDSDIILKFSLIDGDLLRT
jgi:hypothetical protein